MKRELIVIFALCFLLVVGIGLAEERLVTQDTTTGKFKADATPTGTGTLTVDGLTMGSDEYLTFGIDTLHWDATTHDFRMTDDLYLEDIHPGLVLSDTGSRRGYAIHYHPQTLYPFGIWEGSIDENGGFVGGGFPLMYMDATYTYFPRGIGGTVKMPEMKTGSSQAAAKAVVGELWADSNDNYTVKLGQ